MLMTKLFLRGIWRWGKLSLQRRRSRFLLSLMVIVVAILLVKSHLVEAISRGFIQTDWSGGADTVTTANDTNLTSWTKYYSATSGIDTSVAGQASLKLDVSP